jgi:3-hydroxyacyl-[acyl-carrier-protein] dehydratase
MNKPQSQHDVRPTLFGTKEILEILPHRYPFLFIDKILEMDLEEGYILGQKNVSANEAFFQGHFPGAPIMPGVLILEALAQTGGVLTHQKGFTDKIAVLLKVNQVKFRSPVKPGDVLELEVRSLHCSSKGGRTKGIARVGNRIAVEAEISYALVKKEQI